VRHLRYLSYVLRHKWWVLVAGLKVGAPLWRLLIHDWSKFTPAEWGPYVATFYGDRYRVGSRVEINSFEGFGGEAEIIDRRQSHRGGGRFKVRLLDTGMETWAHDFEVVGLGEFDAAYDRAWLHHQHANPHHWQHWILRFDDGGEGVLPMPEPLVREMAADWMGAGRAIHGTWEVWEWYCKAVAKMTLAPETKRIVESIIRPFANRPSEHAPADAGDGGGEG
jgi:hypothetical protein